MAQEIEYKYLVKNNKWKKELVLAKFDIEQGYLHKTRKTTVRVRIAGAQAFITVKGEKVGNACPEYEYEIPIKDGKEMLKMCPEPHIKKTRYIVADAHGQGWDIDVFKGINKGLVLAEIEVESTSTKAIEPEWAGENVTYDRRYNNTYLSTHKVER